MVRLTNLYRTDFPPKLIHQPADVQVPVNKPHTIECPIESRPESEVRWFKDDSLLEPQLGHTEQSGKELMFFQITKNDSGAYYCEASNQLGSITSAPFKLAVLSSKYFSNPLIISRNKCVCESHSNVALVVIARLSCLRRRAYCCVSAETSNQSLAFQTCRRASKFRL